MLLCCLKVDECDCRGSLRKDAPCDGVETYILTGLTTRSDGFTLTLINSSFFSPFIVYVYVTQNSKLSCRIERIALNSQSSNVLFYGRL